VLEAAVEALAAALLFAVGSALQHRASSAARLTGATPSRLASFVRSVLANPVWALALGVEGLGVGFHAVALHEGTLVLVQPLLVTSVVFALVVRRQLDRTTVAVSEVGWAAVLAAGLALFLVTATPANGSAQPADTVPAVAISAACAATVVVAAALSRLVGGGARPVLLAVGAGVAYAGTAALIKTSGDVLVANGWVGLLGSWPLWATLVVGAVGTVLNQLAFQAGPLSASLPVIQTVDPVLSLVFGVVVYDEQLRHGALSLGAEAIGLAATLVAAAALSRGPGARPGDAAGAGGTVRPSVGGA
jgi:hypothetical protein